jgi:tetratricopeptide (TPR) repeat protein
MIKMAQVWDKKGDAKEVAASLQRSLQEVEKTSQKQPALLAQIQSELGWYELRRGNLPEAKSQLRKGLQLVEDTNHYAVLASILNRLGAVYYYRSDWVQAMEQVKRALDMRDHLGDLAGYARSLNNLGILQEVSGNWDEALKSYERAAQLQQEMGEIEGLALVWINIGILYTERGDWEEAERILSQGLEVVMRIGHVHELAQVHLNLGRLYLFRNEWEKCEENLLMAIKLYKELGADFHPNLVDAYLLKAQLQLEQGNMKKAAKWVSQVSKLLKEESKESQVGGITVGRYEQLQGRIAAASKDTETAKEHYESSLQHLAQSHSEIDIGRTDYHYGKLLVRSNKIAEAYTYFKKAQNIFTKLGATADLNLVQKELESLEANEDLR